MWSSSNDAVYRYALLWILYCEENGSNIKYEEGDAQKKYQDKINKQIQIRQLGIRVRDKLLPQLEEFKYLRFLCGVGD